MSNKEIVDQAWAHIERPCINAQSKRIKIYERFGRALNKAMIKDKKKTEPDEEDKKNLKKFSEVVPIELFVSKVSQWRVRSFKIHYFNSILTQIIH